MSEEAGCKEPGEGAPLLLHAYAGRQGPSGPAASEGAPLLANAWPAGSSPCPKCSGARSEVSQAGINAQLAAAAGVGEGPPAISGVEPSQGSVFRHPGTPWGMTAGLLLADMFGIGSLALPSVFARLGWLVSFMLLVTFGLGCGYLGILFSRLAVALPNATTFDDIGTAAMGKTGRRLVFGCVYLTILVDPIALHITCMLALQQMFTNLSALMASALIAVIMLPLAQIQNIHDIAWLSVVATCCMIAAVGATLIKLLAMPGSRLHATSLLPPPETRAIEGLVAALNLSFAFGGQVNWMRYITSMAHPEEFRFAAEVADGLMSVFYVLLAVVAYSKLGADFDHTRPITSVLPHDGWMVAINTALLIRCLVAYILNANVFTDLALRLGRPWLSRVEEASPRLGRKASWALISLCCITMSFLVAWTVPLFSTVLAIIAAIGDICAPYTLPALFGLVLLTDIHRWERWLLKTLVPVSILLTVAGLYAAVYSLAESVTA